MALENIIKKISSDSENEIREIQKTTEEKILSLENKADQENKAIQSNLMAKFKEKAGKYLENAANEANGYLKNEILKKKQELIDKFYRKMSLEIPELPQKDYSTFLASLLIKIPSEEKMEIICAKKDKNLIAEIMKKSKSAQKLSDKTIERSGGFIARGKETEIDATMETLIGQLKEKTIIEIGKILFS